MSDEKVSVHLGIEATAALREIAILMGNVPQNEAMSKILGDVLFIHRSLSKGWHFYIERRNERREVAWDLNATI